MNTILDLLYFDIKFIRRDQKQRKNGEACRGPTYSPNIRLTIWLVGAGLLSVSWPIGVEQVVFVCSSVSVVLQAPQGSPGVVSQRVVTVESSSLLHHSLFIDFNCCP